MNISRFSYQIVRGKNLASAFRSYPSTSQERKISSVFDLSLIQASLDDDETDALVSAVTKHDLIGIVMSQLFDESDGA